MRRALLVLALCAALSDRELPRRSASSTRQSRPGTRATAAVKEFCSTPSGSSTASYGGWRSA